VILIVDPPLVHSISYGWYEPKQCDVTDACKLDGYKNYIFVTDHHLTMCCHLIVSLPNNTSIVPRSNSKSLVCVMSFDLKQWTLKGKQSTSQELEESLFSYLLEMTGLQKQVITYVDRLIHSQTHNRFPLPTDPANCPLDPNIYCPSGNCDFTSSQCLGIRMTQGVGVSL